MGAVASINGSIHICINTGAYMACKVLLLQIIELLLLNNNGFTVRNKVWVLSNGHSYQIYKYRLYSQANCSDTIAFFLVGKRVCISVGCTVPKEKLPFANVNIIQVFYRCKWNAKNIIGKKFFSLGVLG